jgi:hypothetical protein
MRLLHRLLSRTGGGGEGDIPLPGDLPIDIPEEGDLPDPGTTVSNGILSPCDKPCVMTSILQCAQLSAAAFCLQDAQRSAAQSEDLIHLCCALLAPPYDRCRL